MYLKLDVATDSFVPVYNVSWNDCDVILRNNMHVGDDLRLLCRGGMSFRNCLRFYYARGEYINARRSRIRLR